MRILAEVVGAIIMLGIFGYGVMKIGNAIVKRDVPAEPKVDTQQKDETK